MQWTIPSVPPLSPILNPPFRLSLTVCGSDIRKVEGLYSAPPPVRLRRSAPQRYR
jgi:hypothetical protein